MVGNGVIENEPMAKRRKAKKLIEIATNEAGEVLWREGYPYRRLSRHGEEMVRDSIAYVVVSSFLRDGVVHTVLRRARTSPPNPAVC